MHCDAFHWGVTSKKKHRNCSPCACANCLPHQRYSNGSLAEQKNQLNSKLHAILPYLAQDSAHDVMQMHMKYINDVQRVQNAVDGYVNGSSTKAPFPCFVVDAIYLGRVASNTFLQRDYLAAGAQNERYFNPHGNEKRKMIPNVLHCNALKSLCETSTDGRTFNWVAHNKDIKSLMKFVLHHRPALSWLLRLEKKETLQGVTKTGDLVRLESRVLPVKDLFRHWSCKNREAQLVFPSVIASLSHFVQLPHMDERRQRMYEYDPEAFLQLRNRAPIPLTALLQLGTHGLPPNHISLDCIDVVDLIITVAKHEYRQVSEPCPIRGEGTDRLTTLHGSLLPPVVINLPRLVCHKFVTS